MLAIIAVIVLAVLVAGIAIGALLARERYVERRAKLAAREAQLQAVWDALQTNNRINWAFFQARRAMRAESARIRNEREGS